MSNIYKNEALRTLLFGAAVFAFVLCAGIALAFSAPLGVAHADLDWGDAEWGDCCGDSGGDGGECCYPEDDGCCYPEDDCGGCYPEDDGCCYPEDDCGGCYPEDDGCDWECYPEDDDCWECWESEEYQEGSSGERYSSSGGGGSWGSGWSAPAPRSYSTPMHYASPIMVSSGHSYAQPVSYVQPHPIVTPVSHVTHNVSHIDNSINDSFNTLNYNSGNVNSGNISMVPIAMPAAAYIPPVQAHPTPYCTITITNQYGLGYGYGQQTVTWNSTNAHSASINPVIGSVSMNGSRIVSTMPGSVYTMTVWGPGGSSTCQTQPMYAPVPVPSTPHVALSQIPYTGFDYGPVGNAMYWMSLALVAFAGSYLMVYYKGGMLAFAGSMMGRGNEERSSRLAEFTPLPESAFAPAKKVEARQDTKVGYMGTFDTMSFARSENGAPKIVINRA